uniref:NACHT domain-containing protein n=1 Tax=Palpitomonas bilix TaxID=652834 RepID=A0A7S3DJ37_9EUKA|mmetsp:Transcript_40320/g.104548  ORF Transcript_40320/g.104548 Transcript_40320/m.104548 type:complete len:1037 (+) Transcript_40320:221-3331(+)
MGAGSSAQASGKAHTDEPSLRAEGYSGYAEPMSGPTAEKQQAEVDAMRQALEEKSREVEAKAKELEKMKAEFENEKKAADQKVEDLMGKTHELTKQLNVQAADQSKKAVLDEIFHENQFLSKENRELQEMVAKLRQELGTVANDDYQWHKNQHRWTGPPPVFRVFVACEFGGFEALRENLSQQVFVEMYKDCIHRGIVFSAVDLRWGATRKGYAFDIHRAVASLKEVENCNALLTLIGDDDMNVFDLDKMEAEAAEMRGGDGSDMDLDEEDLELLALAGDGPIGGANDLPPELIAKLEAKEAAPDEDPQEKKEREQAEVMEKVEKLKMRYTTSKQWAELKAGLTEIETRLALGLIDEGDLAKKNELQFEPCVSTAMICKGPKISYSKDSFWARLEGLRVGVDGEEDVVEAPDSITFADDAIKLDADRIRYFTFDHLSDDKEGGIDVIKMRLMQAISVVHPQQSASALDLLGLPHLSIFYAKAAPCDQIQSGRALTSDSTLTTQDIHLSAGGGIGAGGPASIGSHHCGAYGCFHGREHFVSVLDKFVQADTGGAGVGKGLAVFGMAGSGKSGLVTNWARECKMKFPNSFVVYHSIGSTTESRSVYNLLTRVSLELQMHFGFASLRSGKMTEAIKIFRMCLWKANFHASNANSKVIIILDGLNNLDKEESLSVLEWLPTDFPSNVKVVVTSTISLSDHDNVNELRARQYEELELSLVDVQSRYNAFVELLNRYKGRRAGLEFEEDDLIAAVSSKGCSLPLQVQAIAFSAGMEEKGDLYDHIDEYLDCESNKDIFHMLLSRFESKYGADLIEKLLGCIACSRRGLTEMELLSVTRTFARQVIPAVTGMGFLLLQPSGLLNFFHSAFRDTVIERYLSDENKKRAAHLTLADYFEYLVEMNPRKVDELPYHLAQAREVERLQTVLSDITMFLNLSSTSKREELIGYWKAAGGIEKAGPVYKDTLSMLVDAGSTMYSRVEIIQTRAAIAEFFLDAGLVEEGMAFFEQEVGAIFAEGDKMRDEIKSTLAGTTVHEDENYGGEE